MLRPREQILLLLLITATHALAQSLERQVYATNGASLLSGEVQLDQTIGQPAWLTLEGALFTLTQGFQQPPNAITTGHQGFGTGSVEVSLFPNPTRDKVHVRSLGWTGIVDASVIDGMGRRCQDQGPHMLSGDDVFSIEFDHLAPGTYYLQLRGRSDGTVHTYPVIKLD